MSLIELKKYMMQVKMTTLANLCIIFNCDKKTVRVLLDYWIKKGKIRQCLLNRACLKACQSNCFKCTEVPAIQEIYEWLPIASQH